MNTPREITQIFLNTPGLPRILKITRTLSGIRYVYHGHTGEECLFKDMPELLTLSAVALLLVGRMASPELPKELRDQSLVTWIRIGPTMHLVTLTPLEQSNDQNKRFRILSSGGMINKGPFDTEDLLKHIGTLSLEDWNDRRPQRKTKANA